MRLRNIVEKVMSQKPTEAMVRNFEKRTKEHIDRVAKNLHKLHEKTDWGDELLERAAVHDDSSMVKRKKNHIFGLLNFIVVRMLGLILNILLG